MPKQPPGVVPAQEIAANQVCIQMPEGVMTAEMLPWDTWAIISGRAAAVQRAE